MSVFGKTNVGADTSGIGGNTKRVQHYIVPADCDELDGIFLYLGPDAAGTTNWRAICYADSGGAPGALIAVGAQVAVSGSAAAAWYESLFTSCPVTPGAEVWIGEWNDASAINKYYYDVVTAERYGNAQTYAATGNPSDPFGAGSLSDNNQEMSLYASYTPVGGLFVPKILNYRTA